MRHQSALLVERQPFGADCKRASPASMRGVFLALALLLFYVGQCVWFIGTQSFTVDEPTHIRAGIEAVRNGRFIVDDQPPLARLLYGMVLHDPKWQLAVTQVPGASVVTSVQPAPEAMAWRARLVNMSLGVVLGVLLWFSARRFFSEPAANVALALFVFSSEVIAHFSLATTDGAGTLLVFATAMQVVNWREKPSWLHTLVMGGVMGLLLLAKFYTAPIFLLAVLLLLVAPRAKRKFTKIAAVLAIAFVTVWAGYLFHVSELTLHQGTMIITFPNRQPQIRKLAKYSSLDLHLYVPAGEYLEGFRDVAFHNHRGQRSFFLGNVSAQGGWKLYFPVAMMLKWPTIVLVLGLVVTRFAFVRRIALPWEFGLAALFPALLFTFAIFSKINIGVRHVLPIYPFAVLFCAAIWERLQSSRIWRWVLYAALVGNAVDCSRYAPGYLSYFTPFVRASQTYHLLADSNLDWGQGLLAVRKYQFQHPEEQIYLAYFGSVDPALYGIRSRPLGEGQRVSGTVIVGASQLAGPTLKDPNAFRWLFQYPILAILDHSMYVFKVPPSGSRT